MEASALQDMQAAYVESGIWTMESPRESAVVPLELLKISPEEEADLNRMAAAVYRVYGELLDVANQGSSDWQFQTVKNKGGPFKGDLTSPPAVRVDVVRTSDGLRIVEIDPATAISLGETSFLSDMWSARSDGVLEARLAQLSADRVRSIGTTVLKILIPYEVKQYVSELCYFGQKMTEEGIDTGCYGTGPSNELIFSGFKKGEFNRIDDESAFLWVPFEAGNVRRWINKKDPSQLPRQDQFLWQALAGLSDKRWLSTLTQPSERGKVESFATLKYLQALSEYVPVTCFYPEDIDALDEDIRLIAKPRDSMGSRGIVPNLTKEIAKGWAYGEGSYIFQEQLEPLVDDFGPCIAPNGEIFEFSEGWISRISVYCGAKGVEGVQVTARPKANNGFTNAHGQADAIQTAMAVDSAKI